MKTSSVLAAALWAAQRHQHATAFTPQSLRHIKRPFSQQHRRRSNGRTGTASDMQHSDFEEFDHLFSEHGEPTQNTFNRRIAIGERDGRRIVLASAAAVDTAAEQEYMATGQTDNIDTDTTFEDPYADLTGMSPQALRLQQQQQQPSSLSERIETRLKSMDLLDIIGTLILPSIIVFAGGRWVFNRAASKANASLDTTLDSFAREMIYHDGDEDEMRLCVKSYNKKLAILGPKKNDAMLKRYLQLYAKKKTVSPEAISSLSTVFSLFNLSEQRAADLLVSLCRQMGGEKIASSQKLLFFGSRILQSPEGLAALEPIKDMIKATYREQTVAETLVETSQQAMGEAAYRAGVQRAGPNQTSLTAGWKVLGLSQEEAQRIFEEEAKEGFKTMRETMYGGQSTKYDAKGNPIDKEGKLVDPDSAIGKDEPEQDAPTSNVYECGNCGYTLFVAKGRETKFFGEGFKCPECGAAKDQFNPRDLDSE